MLFNLKDLKEALGDEILHIEKDYQFSVGDVVFDNREVKDYSMFVAKKGENTDGHSYIRATLEKNSTVVALAERIPDGIDEINKKRIILVKNTTRSFEKLAAFSRNRIKGVVIGITGSLGKTTTKDLAFHCLSNFARSSKNQFSFNNYTGILTTLVNASADTKYAIFEIGMNQKGEIEQLVNLVKPDIAVINNVEMAHSEFFKNVEEIASEKVKIFEKYAKTAILNSGNSNFKYCLNLVNKNKNIKNIITFANRDTEANVNLKSFSIDSARASGLYVIDGKEYRAEFDNLDKNILVNFLPVLAIANVLNLDIEKIIKCAKNFETTRGRNNLETTEYEHRGEKIKLSIINGSYNAVNPKAFESGFELIKLIGNKFARKICIFGGIHEAGENSLVFNTSLLEPIVENNIDLLITVGKVIEPLHEKAKNTNLKCIHFDDAKAAIAEVKNLLKNNDLVFIKGSKGTHVFEVFNHLTNNPMKVFF